MNVALYIVLIIMQILRKMSCDKSCLYKLTKPLSFTLTEKNIVQATYGVYRCLTMTPDA